jgi:selenide,water dikinase
MKKYVPLTSLVKTSGCAAKLSPDILHRVLEQLPKFENPNLMVGYDTRDDACVYKISDSLAMLQTVDFFPPMIDDPYTFGQIAAANALSDIYAMGGTPMTAMNLVCFPSCLDTVILQEILEGGYSKVKEAGAVIAGGHTITDPIPKYGLSVTGFAHPDKILTNSLAAPGDVLVLTKPIGIGIMNTAAKAEMLEASQIRLVTDIMSTLNRYAKESMEGLTVHSCTDITGFGLAGHSFEMASASNKTLEIFTEQIPVMEDALTFASMGIIPEGMYHNLDYLKGKFCFQNKLSQNRMDLLFDPQTSGGLLIAMPLKDAKEFLSRMEQFNHWVKIIGQVTEKQEFPLLFY